MFTLSKNEGRYNFFTTPINQYRGLVGDETGDVETDDDVEALDDVDAEDDVEILDEVEIDDDVETLDDVDTEDDVETLDDVEADDDVEALDDVDADDVEIDDNVDAELVVETLQHK